MLKEIFLQASPGGGDWTQFLLIGGVIVIFYFFFIRPQQKKQKDQKKFIEAIKKGDQVVLVGFGTFSVKDRAARTGRNPQTGQPIQIAAAKIPSFKAGKALKDALN